jgi:glycine/D-amino acid oxidase-like deaminating enzyme
MPAIKHVRSDEKLPARASVCVIGGGVAGVTTALELAERGIDVVLLEKGEIAAEQSSRNWGWCRQMGRDAREIPLIQVSLRLWDGMNARVEGETGFTRCGILYLCENEQQLADKTAWFEKNAKPAGLSTRMIGAAEANELQPGCTRPWKGALYTPDDARAEPFLAVPLMAEALKRKGGKVFTKCAVRGLETKAGRVSAVVTERGSIACDTVVLAGGAWSRRFCENLGVALPQLTVVNSVMRTEPLDTGSHAHVFRRALHLPQAHGWRLYRHAQSLFGRRHRAGFIPAVPRLPARADAGLEGAAAAARQALHRRGTAQAALGAGRGVALRGGAGSRSLSRCAIFSMMRRSTSRNIIPCSSR